MPCRASCCVLTRRYYDTYSPQLAVVALEKTGAPERNSTNFARANRHGTDEDTLYGWFGTLLRYNLH